MTTAVRHKTLTIADLYDQPPLMPLWPDFGGGVLLLSESSTYLFAAQKRLPVETVRLGRKQYVRTTDVLTWLNLPENSDAPKAATSEASSEHVSETPSKQIGTRS
ncbi:helix-turn-helix domain-containing protein [Streptomyces sp. NPDC055025]